MNENTQDAEAATDADRDAYIITMATRMAARIRNLGPGQPLRGAYKYRHPSQN